MGDVIIALVPAPGHEGLVAEGPMGERPALLCRFGSTGTWGPFDADFASAAVSAGADFNEREWRWALVLHAPGGPKLGMVRLQAALHPYLRDFDPGSIPAPPDFEARSFEFCAAWCAAHLAVQRGLGVEVLVLPVATG